MQMDVFLHNGRFGKLRLDSFETLANELNRDKLHGIPISLLLEFFAKYAKALTKQRLHLPGVLYLSQWLRRSNLRRLLELNLGYISALDEFTPFDGKTSLRAQPRGVVCHWVAGNVPTLAAFSLVQSMLAKNCNIIRVPADCVDDLVSVIEPMLDIDVKQDGIVLTGRQLLETFSIVHFPSDDRVANTAMSKVADCKVIWGGKQALDSILSLPQSSHCEAIAFGPKYSFCVADESSVTPALCESLIKDVVAFEQDACSSPHVLFYETDDPTDDGLGSLLDMLKAAFNKISPKISKPKVAYPEVLNSRGVYLLDPDKTVVSSEDLEWSILVDRRLQLEEPIGSRTIFVKPVSSVMDIAPLVTRKIQTMAIALASEAKALEFCEQVTRAGVDRCVLFGNMNNYDSPWDGTLAINRLVRWTSLQTSE